MKKLIIAIAAITIAVMVVPPMGYADEFYVIRDQNGQMAVTNGLPGYGWSAQSGPYSSIDAAQRATGTGTGSPWMYSRRRAPNFPQIVPRFPGQAPMAEVTP